MKLAVALATVLAVALAKPELYKEKEDFQYSRSSSDEGTKAGYYGAQRGNMGGNYERAHNMDSLAQHQMGGLVKQVDGELGDAASAKAGNVFAASNSRGIYGSGHYDLSNLQGRDFREGTSYTDSTSASRYSDYRHTNTGYHNAQSLDSSQHSLDSSRHSLDSSRHSLDSSQHSLDSSQRLGRYYGQNADSSLASVGTENVDTGLYGSTGQASRYHKETGYRSESGYQRNSAQGNSNAYGTNGYGSNVKSRLVSTSPVRVMVRPGGRVVIPVAAQTYDSRHRDTAALYETNYNANSEAADLNSIDTVGVKPASTGKHYESSYKYHKEWEKHDTNPVAVPLAIPTVAVPINDDEQYRNTYNAAHETNSHSGYNVKSSSQSQHQANYNAQQYGSNSIDSEASKFSSDQLSKTNQDALTTVLGSNKPNGYQSSYSYHKSWERQGDPYVIKPISNSHVSQRYHTTNQNYQNADCDCDDDQHYRARRSYGQEQEAQNVEDLGQQTQNIEQESQNLMDFGQQSQNLQDFGQQSQNLDEFGQQSQNLEDFGQQAQSQKLEDFGQQTQKLEDFGQQNQKLDDFGKQSQNLNDFGQQSQKLDDFGQQSQNLNDFGQQSQKLDDFGQQSQKLNDFGQETQQLETFGQQTQSQNLEDFGQQVQKSNLHDFGQTTQNQWAKWENLGQQQQETQNNYAKTQHRSRRENTNDWQQYKNLGAQTNKNWEELRANGNWENAGALRQQTDKDWQDARKQYGEHRHEHNDKDQHHHY